MLKEIRIDGQRPGKENLCALASIKLKSLTGMVFAMSAKIFFNCLGRLGAALMVLSSMCPLSVAV